MTCTRRAGSFVRYLSRKSGRGIDVSRQATLGRTVKTYTHLPRFLWVRGHGAAAGEGMSARRLWLTMAVENN